MSLPDLQASDLVAWVERTSANWFRLLTRHPETLAFPCGIRETSNVAQLLQHIVAVELRYAERLSDLPQTPYEAIPCDSIPSLVTTHARAMALVHALHAHDAAWWQQPITFPTRSAGTLTSPRSVILFHLLLHSVRHYAQLATLLRPHGIAPDWMTDYLDMGLTPPT